MSEENKTGENTSENKPSELTNFKAEMDRKLSNITDTLKQTTETLKSQLAALAPKPDPKPLSTKAFKEKFYEDEDAAIGEVMDVTEKRIMTKIDQRTRLAETVNRLYGDYPELSDVNNPLTQKAVEILKTYSPEEQQTPAVYRASVLEAATSLGVIPKSKRQKETTDDYTGGGNDRGNGTNKKGELDPKTMDFARLMGLNVDDPKVVERLKKRNERGNWTSFQ